jgi:hypothetical protein
VLACSCFLYRGNRCRGSVGGNRASSSANDPTMAGSFLAARRQRWNLNFAIASFSVRSLARFSKVLLVHDASCP